MDRGIVLVENLGIGDIPNTPKNSNFNNLTLNPSRNILLKYAQVYGWPISFAQEQKGQLIQNIYFRLRKQKINRFLLRPK